MAKAKAVTPKVDDKILCTRSDGQPALIPRWRLSRLKEEGRIIKEGYTAPKQKKEKPAAPVVSADREAELIKREKELNSREAAIEKKEKAAGKDKPDKGEKKPGRRSAK
jgi:hypothetical protein